MLNKKIKMRAAIFALQIAIIAGCTTPQTIDESTSTDGAAAAAAEAKRIAEDAIIAQRDIRMAIGEAKRAAERAAEAAERAARAAESAAAEAKAAADKADRIFQRQMRK